MSEDTQASASSCFITSDLNSAFPQARQGLPVPLTGLLHIPTLLSTGLGKGQPGKLSQRPEEHFI